MSCFSFRIITQSIIPYRNLVVDLFLLAFLVSIPFLRVGLDGVIRPLDSDFPLYPKDQIYKYSYVWFESGAMFGNDGSFTALSQNIFYLIPAFLSYTGLTINLVNRITLISYGTVAAWSAYIMTYLLIPNRRRFTPILAGLLFFYNPYILGELNLGHWFSILSYSALPIMLLATIKGLTECHWKRWSLILGMASVLALPRIRFFPIILEVLGIYVLFWLFQKKSWSKLIHILKFVVVSFCSILVFNLWWILPTLANLNSVYSLLVTPPTTSFSSFSFPTTFLTDYSFSNIIGLVGYGIPLDQSYGAYFQSPLYLLLEIMLILSIFSVLVFRWNRFVNFFAIISGVFLGFIISITYVMPIYNFYGWLSVNSPSPINFLLFPMGFEYRGIVIALSYAFLLGAGYNEVFRNEVPQKANRFYSRFLNKLFLFFAKRNFWKNFCAVLLVVLILVNSWPLFGGVKNDFLEPVIVPSYYDEARQWLNTQSGDFKILSLPHPYWIYFIKTPWAFNGTKDVSDVIQQVFPVPILSSKPGFGYAKDGSELLNILYESLPESSSQGPLSLLGCKYIVIRNDIIDSSFDVSYFKNNTNLILEKTIGDLDFYLNPSYSPLAYPSASVYSLWGDADLLVPLTYFPDFQWNNTTFVSLKDLSQEDIDFYLNFSNGLVVYNTPPNASIINKITEKQIPILYVFNWTFPRSIKILTDGIYTLESRAIDGNESENTALNLKKDEILYNPNFDFSLPSTSMNIYGTTQENDSATMETSTLLSDSNITWQCSSVPGWHGLVTSINQTEWQLGSLAQENGAIFLNMKGDQSGGEIRLSFNSADESRFFWPTQTIYLNWSGWKEFVLPLNQFEKIGKLEWDEPWSFWIWQEVPNEATGLFEIQVSNITRLHGAKFSILKPNDTLTTDLSKTKVEIDKVSPVKYRINVTTEKPFFLILNQAYNDGWNARIKNQELQHFRANFYANGYYVPNVGNFSIEVTYSGQQYFELGAVISATTIALSAFYFVNGLEYFQVIAHSLFTQVIATIKELHQRLVNRIRKKRPM